VSAYFETEEGKEVIVFVQMECMGIRLYDALGLATNAHVMCPVMNLMMRGSDHAMVFHDV
jgi:hypothetical protein